MERGKPNVSQELLDRGSFRITLTFFRRSRKIETLGETIQGTAEVVGKGTVLLGWFSAIGQKDEQFQIHLNRRLLAEVTLRWGKGVWVKDRGNPELAAKAGDLSIKKLKAGNAKKWMDHA